MSINVEVFSTPGCGRCAQAIGGILLILSGRYLLNAYFIIVPELAA